jgi:methyl coenzyme M reductase subunit C-like uncharacterized protein (methanogenesis marker protein 7)
MVDYRVVATLLRTHRLTHDAPMSVASCTMQHGASMLAIDLARRRGRREGGGGGGGGGGGEARGIIL